MLDKILAVPYRHGSIVPTWPALPVGDLCVWGQAFGRRDDHEGQVADVVNDMRADPTAFERWWFTDQQHRETGE